MLNGVASRGDAGQLVGELASAASRSRSSVRRKTSGAAHGL